CECGEVACIFLLWGAPLEPPWEGHRGAVAVFFVATVGGPRPRAEPLVALTPARLYRVRSAECAANVVRPDVGGEPVVAIVRHADHIRFVGPGDRGEHGAKDLLTRQAPVVRHIREDGGDCVIAFAERPLLGWKAAG